MEATTVPLTTIVHVAVPILVAQLTSLIIMEAQNTQDTVAILLVVIVIVGAGTQAAQIVERTVATATKHLIVQTDSVYVAVIDQRLNAIATSARVPMTGPVQTDTVYAAVIDQRLNAIATSRMVPMTGPVPIIL